LPKSLNFNNFLIETPQINEKINHATFNLYTSSTPPHDSSQIPSSISADAVWIVYKEKGQVLKSLLNDVNQPQPPYQIAKWFKTDPIFAPCC
jgi:hypothetical protein